MTPVEVVLAGLVSLGGLAGIIGGLFVTRREWEQYRAAEAANRSEMLDSLRELRDWTRERPGV